MTPKRAIAEIIARSDLCDLQGKPVLVVSMTSELLDYLAAFGAVVEDLEPEEDDDDEQEGLQCP